MMDRLRVTAAYFIKESNLTKAAKLQLMNFLENEASGAQVMALLLDGKVQALDEMAEEIVYDRWDAALLDEKWKKDVEIRSTGEHAGKSIGQLKKQVAALKGKPGNKEKMGELLFAIRAKQGWKKKTGV
jgi:hypothetical protein